MNDRRLWRGAAVLLVLALAGVALWFSPLGQRFDAAAIVAWAREQRGAWWAIPLYFAVYAAMAVLFIPLQPLSIAAVVVWGWWWGGLIELAAATLGCIPPYLIARGALREPIAERLQKHRHVSAVLEREGFTVLLVLRVIAVIPYPILNYLAGLSSLRPLRYLTASAIGMIPSVFIFAYLVEAVVEGVLEPRQVVTRLLIAGSLLAVLVIVTRLVAPRLRRRLEL